MIKELSLLLTGLQNTQTAGLQVLRREPLMIKTRFPRSILIARAVCLIVMAFAYFFNLYQMSRIPDLIKARIIERHSGKSPVDFFTDTEWRVQKDGL